MNDVPEANPQAPAAENIAGASKLKVVHGNGTVPEELPEESQTPQTVRPAAAAEKFSKFAEMRENPRSSLIQTRRRLVAIPALKMPGQDWFVRTSTRPGHSGILPLCWDKGGDGKPFLIDGPMQDYFGTDVRNNYCVLSITRQKTLFLWCNPLEDEDGTWNSWHQSAHDMKAHAADSWSAFKSNRQINGYEPIDPINENIPNPEWVDLGWSDITRLAFRRYFVEVETHPLIIRRMGG